MKGKEKKTEDRQSGHGIRLSDTHLNFITETVKKYPNYNWDSIMNIFNSHFQIDFSKEKIKLAFYNRGVKLNIPRGPNKPVGTEVFRGDYWWVKISNDRSIPYRKRYKQKHILLWEKINGVIPKDHNIIFLDGNVNNCVIENLASIPRSLNGIMAILHLYSDNPEATKIGIKIAELHLLLDKKQSMQLGEKEFKRQKQRKLYNNWYARKKAKNKREIEI